MMQPKEDRKYIQGLLNEHNRWRQSTLNLIASENIHSPAVRAALDSDLISRYASYADRDLTSRKYCGGRYVTEIEKRVYEQVLRSFHTEFAELRPISGHLAGTAVLAALCKPEDVILELGRDGGGHRQATRQNSAKLIPLQAKNLPFDGQRYNVDIDKTKEIIQEYRPRAIILGSSSFLFPHPIQEIKEILHKINPTTILVYDASHVMGFLAVGEFQNPLLEGADVVFGSTHKTLPGPQGGLIFSNRSDLIEQISKAVYPALVTSHHVFRMPALGIALAEMEEFGKDYVRQIVANSQALGVALEEKGIPCVCVDGQYTRSHTLLLKVSKFGKGIDIANHLESLDIITGRTSLPEVHGIEGIRIGVQEITRLGATQDQMPLVASLIADAMTNEGKSRSVLFEVHRFRESLGPVHYTWKSFEEEEIP